MSLIKKPKDFISYWYLRYLTATELYMVEPWERAFVHILFTIMFGLFWYFNSSVVLQGISTLTGSPHYVKQIS